jgi:hypothetical protein
MCSAVATSREHVPPKNLFPEARDIGGANYRVNLVTVPSCDDHNTEKSHDDEFLMVSLAGIIGNNSIGYMHKLGKVDRAVRNSANRLLDQVVIEKKEIHRVELGPNRFHEVIWGTPDVARLRRCFVHIGHGLHQHCFRRRFEGEITVLLGYLFHSEHNAKTWVEFVAARTELELKDKQSVGSNPDVFYYQVSDPDEFNLFAMRLTFYGGLRVFLAFRPKDAIRPTHLATQLISHGMETHITLGEKSFVFNRRKAT